jgi:hypothetical protein
MHRSIYVFNIFHFELRLKKGVLTFDLLYGTHARDISRARFENKVRIILPISSRFYHFRGDPTYMELVFYES